MVFKRARGWGLAWGGGVGFAPGGRSESRQGHVGDGAAEELRHALRGLAAQGPHVVVGDDDALHGAAGRAILRRDRHQSLGRQLDAALGPADKGARPADGGFAVSVRVRHTPERSRMHRDSR